MRRAVLELLQRISFRRNARSAIYSNANFMLHLMIMATHCMMLYREKQDILLPTASVLKSSFFAPEKNLPDRWIQHTQPLVHIRVVTAPFLSVPFRLLQLARIVLCGATGLFLMPYSRSPRCM